MHTSAVTRGSHKSADHSGNHGIWNNNRGWLSLPSVWPDAGGISRAPNNVSMNYYIRHDPGMGHEAGTIFGFCEFRSDTRSATLMIWLKWCAMLKVQCSTGDPSWCRRFKHCHWHSASNQKRCSIRHASRTCETAETNWPNWLSCHRCKHRWAFDSKAKVTGWADRHKSNVVKSLHFFRLPSFPGWSRCVVSAEYY